MALRQKRLASAPSGSWRMNPAPYFPFFCVARRLKYPVFRPPRALRKEKHISWIHTPTTGRGTRCPRSYHGDRPDRPTLCAQTRGIEQDGNGPSFFWVTTYSRTTSGCCKKVKPASSEKCKRWTSIITKAPGAKPNASAARCHSLHLPAMPTWKCCAKTYFYASKVNRHRARTA